jgi:hypothetical protein
VLELKRAVGRATRWTPETPNYDELNGLKREIYHNLDTQLDQVAPGSEDLNARMSNLLSAKSAIERVTPVLERHPDAISRFGFPMIFALEELARSGSLMRAAGGAAVGATANLAKDFLTGTRARTLEAQALRKGANVARTAGDVAQAVRPATSAAVQAGAAGATLAAQKQKSLAERAADYIGNKFPNFFTGTKR